MVKIDYERYEREYVPKSQNSEDYVDCVAEIPECRVNGDPKNDYPDVEDDVRIWKPIPESDEISMPGFMYLLFGKQTKNNNSLEHSEK